MYKILFPSNTLKKKYKEIEEATKDLQGISKITEILENNPKGNSTTHKEISKKGDFWCYKVSWGDRVTYKVLDNKKLRDNKPTVMIYFIGNHKDYMTFLRAN